MGLLVVTGEEEGGASSDFRLLAGLLANLGGRRVETMETFSSSQTSETACCEVDGAGCGGLPIGRSNNNIFWTTCSTALTLQPTQNNICFENNNPKKLVSSQNTSTVPRQN